VRPRLIAYASHFEKDQAVHGFGLGGHRHDQEHCHDRRHPPLVDWTGRPSIELRDALMAADFGAATIQIEDDSFEYLLNAAKPVGIPSVPDA
jgi:hypothetical protein